MCSPSPAVEVGRLGTAAIKGCIYLNNYLGADMHFLNCKIHLGYEKHKLGYHQSVVPYRKILESSKKEAFINVSISDELLPTGRQ